MVASKHINASASFGYGGNFGVTMADGQRTVDELLVGAQDLVLRAPEVTIVLGERAAAVAEAARSTELWARAESLVVSARIRLGHRAVTVARALELVRVTEKAGLSSLAARAQVDLAVCARSVGLPSTGLAPLRAALANTSLSTLWRVTALTHLVGCMAHLGPRKELEDLFEEADELCLHSDELSDAQKLLAKAWVRNASTAYHRRHGDLDGAIQEAKAGCVLLDRLPDSGFDGNALRARLILNLVSVLLDRGDLDSAMTLAQPLLRSTPRAVAAAPIGWLRLAIATRVLLPNGAGTAALSLLRNADHEVDPERLPGLSARLSLELASVEEQFGDPVAAVADLRRARSADRILHGRNRVARDLLRAEFVSGEQFLEEFERMLSPTEKVEHAAAAFVASKSSPPPRRINPSPSPDGRKNPVRSENPVSWRFSVDPPMAEGKKTSSPKNGSGLKPVNTAVGLTEQNTRHDDAHGSVAAQSVLDRLGISSGLSGGKRRASGRISPDTNGSSVDTSFDFRHFLNSTNSFSDSTETHAADSVYVNEGGLKGSSNDVDCDAEPNAESEDNSPIFPFVSTTPSTLDGWLPKLRLPPSLAPIENLMTKSDISVTSSRDVGEPEFSDLAPWNSSQNSGFEEYEDSFSAGNSTSDYGVGSGYDTAIAAEDPPADAGLADLLARALAEHRAGTASAASLVKRLGEHNGARGTSQRVNGYGRSESRANGRHRNQA